MITGISRIEKMGKLSLLFFLLSIVMPSAFADHAKTEPSDGTVNSFIKVSPPQQLDLVKFLDQDEKEVSFAKYRGKVVLINLWATWCGPCIRELPALDSLAAKLKLADFELITISIDREGKSIAQPFFEELGLTELKLYSDPEHKLGKVFPLDVVPATFVLNRHGELIQYLRSFADWEDPQALAMMLDLIAKPPYRYPDGV
jgi:thiol-disulfide isomerase/thioredoxin